MDTDGHLAQCEHVWDLSEAALMRAYEEAVKNQADWIIRNKPAIENLLSDYEESVKDGIDDSVADDVFSEIAQPFDLVLLRALGMQIGG